MYAVNSHMNIWKIFINELGNHTHEGVGGRSAYFGGDWFITKVFYLPSVILVNLW